MEASLLSRLFVDLSTEKPDIIAVAVSKLIAISVESGPEVVADFGVMTERLASTLKRLVKGLASTHHSLKLGYSTCLTALIRAVRIDSSKLLLFYDGLNSASKGKQEYVVGHILLASCLTEADYSLGEDLTDALVAYFKTQESMREAVAEVLAKATLSEAKLEELAEVNDVNYWRLKLNASKGPAGLLAQAFKNKGALLKGSYRTLPRLHSVWPVVLKAALTEGTFKKLWSQFVEKELTTLASHKNLEKHIGFSLGFVYEAVSQGVPVEVSLSAQFAAVWQSSLSDRANKNHTSAVKLKKLALSKVTESTLPPLISLVETASISDLATSLALEVVKTATADVLETTLKQLKDLTDPSSKQFVVAVLDGIERREGFQQICLIELFYHARHDDFAKRKLLAGLSHASLEVIANVFEAWDDKPAKVWKKFNADRKRFSAKPALGKRKAYEATITQSQAEALWRLTLLVTLETAFDPTSELHIGLIEVTSSLIRPKPSKRSTEVPTSPLETLFGILLKLLNKPAHYRKDIAKSTFQEFAADAPMSLVETLCNAVATGQGCIVEAVQEEVKIAAKPPSDYKAKAKAKAKAIAKAKGIAKSKAKQIKEAPAKP